MRLFLTRVLREGWGEGATGVAAAPDGLRTGAKNGPTSDRESSVRALRNSRLCEGEGKGGGKRRDRRIGASADDDESTRAASSAV